MKTFTRIALAGIAAALFTTGGVSASDTDWRSTNYGNAKVEYRGRRVKDGWFFDSLFHGKNGARVETNQNTPLRFGRVTTINGSISYYRPAN